MHGRDKHERALRERERERGGEGEMYVRVID